MESPAEKKWLKLTSVKKHREENMEMDWARFVDATQ